MMLPASTNPRARTPDTRYRPAGEAQPDQGRQAWRPGATPPSSGKPGTRHPPVACPGTAAGESCLFFFFIDRGGCRILPAWERSTRTIFSTW
jgi:hypothetical protein